MVMLSILLKLSLFQLLLFLLPLEDRSVILPPHTHKYQPMHNFLIALAEFHPGKKLSNLLVKQNLLIRFTTLLIL